MPPPPTPTHTNFLLIEKHIRSIVPISAHIQPLQTLKSLSVIILPPSWELEVGSTGNQHSNFLLIEKHMYTKFCLDKCALSSVMCVKNVFQTSFWPPSWEPEVSSTRTPPPPVFFSWMRNIPVPNLVEIGPVVYEKYACVRFRY